MIFGYGLSRESFLFADGSSIFHNVNNNMTHCMEAMNKDLELINKWASQWLVTINAIKTGFMLVSTIRPSIKLLLLKLGNSSLKLKYSHTGTLVLSLCLHLPGMSTQRVLLQRQIRLFVLKHYKYRLSRKALAIGYLTFIRPVINK